MPTHKRIPKLILFLKSTNAFSCEQVGRRLKSALLLTAAFGAAHTALQSELAMECLPM